MTTRIDIFSQKANESSYFDVDISSNYVAMVGQTPLAAYLQTADNLAALQKKDNINVLSYGLSMPLGFEIYNATDVVPPLEVKPPDVAFGFIGQIGNLYSAPNFGDLWLPQWQNYEMSLNNFVEIPDAVFADPSYDRFWLYMNIPGRTDINVSMINVPDVLDEERIYCPFWVKIEHTLDLMAGLPPPPP